MAKDEDKSVRRSVAWAVGNNFVTLTEDYRRLLFTLSEDEATEVKKAVALVIAQKFENLPPKYPGILKKFRSDSRVLDSLKEWIKENEAYSWNEETIEILKRELDI